MRTVDKLRVQRVKIEACKTLFSLTTFECEEDSHSSSSNEYHSRDQRLSEYSMNFSAWSISLSKYDMRCLKHRVPESCRCSNLIDISNLLLDCDKHGRYISA